MAVASSVIARLDRPATSMDPPSSAGLAYAAENQDAGNLARAASAASSGESQAVVHI